MHSQIRDYWVTLNAPREGVVYWLSAHENWPGCADECAFGPLEGTIVVRNGLDRDHFLLAGRVAGEGLSLESVAMGLTSVFGIQGGLVALGYKPGMQDGADGPLTQGAVSKFQADQGLEPTGSTSDASSVDALASKLAEAGFTPLTT